MIATSGMLFIFGFALFSSGLYRACTGARLFDTGEDWSCVALGAVMCAAALAMIARGVG